VGPAQVERHRVITPYVVDTGTAIERTTLTYRFERDVFDPGDPVSLNLAAMMTAQVALNYGLFADEICFAGPYDTADRQILHAMAENTAREITVKKFLEPNPFLRGEARRLPPVPRKRYCHAAIRFTSPRPADAPVPWGRDPARHAVLSSGGKDSLLTLGVLDELGLETYPLFVNEAGRHWLTALNAYRHLARHHGGTGRVWTDADRLFAWFLRRLPFVRPDFADVRSDEYPIRLWTVAVFLFGALPLLRAQRIGRILIGDEFDTTRRVRSFGIPHYDGLFDQSRFFDETMTRYYAAKGWGLEQFSALRWASELLIQKILAERYPELFRHQMSCHAAHLLAGRVRPCGRCEKCRRIVGVLSAFGLDPRRCGYTSAQVDACLTALGTAGVHHEREAAEHLAWLLAEQGLLAVGGQGLPPPRRRPRVMQLRFDPTAAPAGTVPPDLSAPLIRLLLQHADGAVRRDGRRWQPHDPLATGGNRRARSDNHRAMRTRGSHAEERD